MSPELGTAQPQLVVSLVVKFLLKNVYKSFYIFSKFIRSYDINFRVHNKKELRNLKPF